MSDKKADLRRSAEDATSVTPYHRLTDLGADIIGSIPGLDRSSMRP